MKEVTCPLELTFDILRKKWVPIILWRMRLGAQRQTNLKKDIKGINENSLILHLNQLLSFGIIEKKEFDIYPKHTEYNLTPKGRELLQILELSQNFGKKL